MAIKNLFVLFLFSSVLLSCAQAPKINFRNKIEPKQQDQMANQNVEQPAEESEEERIQFETKVSEKPFRPKVALVLGPGLSRSFAHIGVLKELKSAGISVHSVIGMGWSSLVAAEYVDQKSVHGLEWKVSRSEELKKLSETSFWSSAIKEKSLSDAGALASSLLTNYNAKMRRRGEFMCPLLSRRKNAVVLSDKPGLKNCIAAPPFFNPGKNFAPHFFDLASLRESALVSGAEKVIYIDVLNRRPKLFGAKAAAVSSAVYWYWTLARQMTVAEYSIFDKVIEIDVDQEILNFGNALDVVRVGQRHGADLVDFLRQEYQY